jgi:hypothetical protein
MTSIACLSLLGVVVLALWKLFRGYVVKSPLDNIPGPKRTSFWRGMPPKTLAVFLGLTASIGNQRDIFDRHGWGFHDHIIEQYAHVTKLHGPLGVCTHRTALIFGSGLISRFSPGYCTFMTPRL